MMRTFLFFLLTIPMFVFAQNKESKREKIKQLKLAFITSEIDLNSDEAAKFWPIYNEADNEIYEIRKISYAAYSKYIKDKKEAEISEADAKKFVEIINECDAKVLKIKEELSHQLGKTISYKKIVKLKKVEEDFKQKLLEQYKRKK